MILPYAFTTMAKFTGPGFNNNHPRDFLEGLTGFRKRAHWAQLNTFEAFPIFAAAVIIAHMVAGANGTVDALAVAFIVCRIVYGICYMADWASARSLVWFGAYGSALGIFIVAALG